MVFSIKTRSEDLLLNKLVNEIQKLNTLAENLYKAHMKKSDINLEVIEGVKTIGAMYQEKLTKAKTEIMKILEDQGNILSEMNTTVKKIEHHLRLLVHMEQASLAIHSKKKQDDLSDMIDIHTMPMNKFEKEMEHLKMLDSSFEMLNVEIEKQKRYITEFDLNTKTSDEHYFYESGKIENDISYEDIMSILQLKNFCDDLRLMIDEKMGNRMPFISESDKAALAMIAELKTIHVKKGLFSVSMYEFISRLAKQNINSAHSQKLITFFIFFLLSRMKTLNKPAYFAQVRSTILCYNLLNKMSIKKSQRYMISGAALLINLSKLDLKDVKGTSIEMRIIKNYYRSVKQLFKEELAFISSLMDTCRHEGDEPVLQWINDGAKIISLVYEFDRNLQAYNFELGKIETSKDSIFSQMRNIYKGSDKEIAYLLSEWSDILQPSIRM